MQPNLKPVTFLSELIEKCITHPKGFNRNQSKVIYCDENLGFSFLIQSAIKNLKQYKIGFVDCSDAVTLNQFLSCILKGLGVDHNPNSKGDYLDHLISQHIDNCGIELVVFNNISSILLSNPKMKVKQFLNTIQYYWNQFETPFIYNCSEQALKVIKSKKKSLLWRLDFFNLKELTYNEYFRRIISAYAKQMPVLLPSKIIDEEVCQTIYQLSKGSYEILHNLMCNLNKFILKENGPITKELLNDLSKKIVYKKNQIISNKKNTVQQMTHQDLVLRAEKWLYQQKCRIVIRDPFRSANREQPDAIGWSNNNIPILIECKISRSDFLQDKKKPYRMDSQIGMGCWRFYLCPAGIINKNDLPDGWGLLWITNKTIRKIHGFPIGCNWSKPPFDGNKICETEVLVNALRRMKIRGHLEEIYDGIPSSINKDI